MLNDDLIAFLQPAPTRWRPDEWRDVCDTFSDIRVEGARFTLHARLPKGLYRCRIEMLPGSFDMRTAMVPMVQVPDGRSVLVGPWDLNHIDNVMAMPMAKTWVNERLLGGLWFEMPGPEQIAGGRLGADFGFEVDGDGEMVLALEFVENARDRIHWADVQSMEFRTDNRTPRTLLPVSSRHPRIFVNPDEWDALRQRLRADPLFQRQYESLRNSKEDLGQNESNMDVIVAAIAGDETMGKRVRADIVALCRRPTWSGRPDPLLMGGDNDRGIGRRLYYTGIAWEYLRDGFTADERRDILTKVEEYLRKMYDFTVLQRGYMGCPTTDGHSLGAWFGVGTACMSFYDDLAIARRALPFFHGLFVDSLAVFPPGGKTAWATFSPWLLSFYLAAAHTFGGQRPELDKSPYLDHLGKALLASFETPNTQEMQGGKRTGGHRHITAFLSRFHPTAGIDEIYRAFYQREQEQAGDVQLGLFDLLYAPTAEGPVAAFPRGALFVRDIGDLISVARGKPTLAVIFAAGLRYGSRASFSVQPHNRCAAMPLGEIGVQVDGAPVLVNIEGYGLSSATHNSMCFNEGGVVYQGQYLPGALGPEKSSFIRRCLLGDRFIYAHAVLTEALHPSLGIRNAERIFLMDTRTGVVLVHDFFEGRQPLRFATHLHCSGSVTELGRDRYRLTGGQARTIAAGAADLNDDERGTVYVSVLQSETPYQVAVEEPAWCPSYIYGINNKNSRTEGIEPHYPRYRRWRLAAEGQVDRGAFLFAISAEADAVRRRDDGGAALPQGGIAYLAGNAPANTLGCACCAEAVIVDESAKTLMLMGAQRFTMAGRALHFAIPVDMEIALVTGIPRGTIFSSARNPIAQAGGMQIGAWKYDAYHPRSRSRGNWIAAFWGVRRNRGVVRHPQRASTSLKSTDNIKV